MSRILYLHMGLSKTGTSYLQEVFWKNKEHLKQLGLFYPCDDAFLTRLANRPVFSFSGNAAFLFRQQDRMNRLFSELAAQHEGDVLLSTQTVLRPTLPNFEGEKLPFTLFRDSGFDKVRILLFVRDPLEHAVSLWSELIKHGWHLFDGKLDTFIEQYDLPKVTQLGLEEYLKEDIVELEIRNYDVCKSDLVSIVKSWLQLPVGSLALPDRQLTNKSLYPEEVDLILRHTRALGKCVELRNKLFEVMKPSFQPRTVPSLEIQQNLWERQASAISYINLLLPVNEKIGFREMKGCLQNEGPFFFDQTRLEGILHYYLRDQPVSTESQFNEISSSNLSIFRKVIAYFKRNGFSLFS